MKPAHRRVHVVMWAVVLIATLAIIAAGVLLRDGPAPTGPTIRMPPP